MPWHKVCGQTAPQGAISTLDHKTNQLQAKSRDFLICVCLDTQEYTALVFVSVFFFTQWMQVGVEPLSSAAHIQTLCIMQYNCLALSVTYSVITFYCVGLHVNYRHQWAHPQTHARWTIGCFSRLFNCFVSPHVKSPCWISTLIKSFSYQQ